MTGFSARLPLIVIAGLVLPILAACSQPATPSPAAPTQPAAPKSEPTTQVAAQSSGQPASGTPQQGGTFVIAQIGPLAKTLHPYPDAAAYSQSWTDAARMLWSGGLVGLNADTLEYEPDMASSWTVSPDGKTFTFTLKDDLKWSDGRPISVDDFSFAYENAVKDENNYVELDNVQRIDSFTTPDEKTIVVTLKELLARDIAVSVANSIGPVPKHIWQGKSWNDPTANPEILKPSVVIGPFIVRDWNAAESATFERVPSYYSGQANFERVVFRPGQQPTVAYELLKSNQAHWAPDIPPSQYAEAKQNPNLTLYEWTAANSTYRGIEFNLMRPHLSDKRVREAIARSINRQDVIQIAENNLGSPQYSFVNPQNTKWNYPTVEKYEFNLERSKQLLQEAGYRLDGARLLAPDGQQVKFEVLYPSSSNPRKNIGAYLQQQLKLLGIEVDVRGLDFNAYTEEVSRKKNFDISLSSYGGGSIDPDLGPKGQILSTGTQNVTGVKSARIDELFNRGAVEQDDAARKQIYNELQQIVAEELPTFYLYSLSSFSPMSKQILGVKPNKLDRLEYNDGLIKWSIAR
jgi:peptide/nickel transport system substrate-binding protein